MYISKIKKPQIGMMTLRGFIEYLLVFYVILDCNTPYSRAINIDYKFPERIVLLSVILLFMELPGTKIRPETVFRFILALSIYMLAAIAYLIIGVDKAAYVSYLMRYILFVPLMTILFGLYQRKGKPYQILVRYSDVMVMLSIASLVMWLLGSNLHIIKPNSTIEASWGSKYLYPSFFGVYFERQVDSMLFYTGYRNMGIFCEAPMFSLNLVLAIAIELFFRGNEKKNDTNKSSTYIRSLLTIRIAILIIALVTTMTTAGYIMLIIIIMAAYMMDKPRNHLMKRLKIINALILFAICLMSIILLLTNKAESNSWAIRVDDIHAGYSAWLQKPLIGNGYGDETQIQKYMSSFRSGNKGYSNTIILLLAQGGVLFSSIYIYPLVASAMRGIKQKNKGFLVFVFLVSLELIMSIFPFAFLMLVLLSFFYSHAISDKQ